MSNELQPVYAGEAEVMEGEGVEQNTFLDGVTGKTPWWIVSVLMHALIIALAALLSVAIDLPDNNDSLQTVTIFPSEPPKLAVTEPQKPDTAAPLEPKKPSNGEADDGENV